MKLLRLVAAVLVVVTLAVLSIRTTCTTATAPPAVPCTTGALAMGFGGELHLSSIQNYGCEGSWAFAWATIGTGEHAIGVTEVLHYDTARARWGIVSRASECKPTILPSVVYRQGCFSN